jgi:isoprenylcysteine carboxyl methyltransferase (ICMT) family protein YpbQ
MYLYYFLIHSLCSSIYGDISQAIVCTILLIAQEIYRRWGIKNISSTWNRNIYLVQVLTENFTDVISWYT